MCNSVLTIRKLLKDFLCELWLRSVNSNHLLLRIWDFYTWKSKYLFLMLQDDGNVRKNFIMGKVSSVTWSIIAEVQWRVFFDNHWISHRLKTRRLQLSSVHFKQSITKKTYFKEVLHCTSFCSSQIIKYCSSQPFEQYLSKTLRLSVKNFNKILLDLFS